MVTLRFLVLSLMLSCLGAGTAENKKPRAAVWPPRIDGTRVETYRRVEDVNLRVWIMEPDGESATNRPAMVFFFGGGWNGGSPTQFESQARHFAARGMVTLLADYRVKSRQGVKPAECVVDAKSCVRWIRSNAARLRVDPDRIVAAGGSAGGHLAAATATLPDAVDPEGNPLVSCVPNALILYNPVLVLAEYGDLKLEGFGNRLSAERLGAEPEALSPIHHLQDDAPPALILHGKADTTVPYSSAEAFEKAMRDRGSRCELIGYEGQPHGFFNPNRGGGKAYGETLAEADRFLVSLGYLKAQ